MSVVVNVAQCYFIFHYIYIVPSAHPGLASVPVPTSTLHATSVILRWDPIPADEANGELCYQIILSVIDQVTSMSRRRRHALTNTLGQCLNEAGMKISTKFEVPGNENSVTVTNIGMSSLVYLK